MERLAQEPLDLTSTSNCQLVIFTELIHSQNGNNVLKILIVLENFLNTTSSIIVFFTQNTRREHARCRIQGVDSRIDTKLRNLIINQKSEKARTPKKWFLYFRWMKVKDRVTHLPGQHCRGIKMGKSGCGSWICQVISRDINSLNRCDWTLLGSSNTLLKFSKICSQGRLVTNSRWYTAKQSRHLRVSLQNKIEKLAGLANQKKLFPKKIIQEKMTSRLTWVKRKMLSMKRSTSWPSASRKCSATVSPVSPTRARAPGGSFIWPYTRAHLLSSWYLRECYQGKYDILWIINHQKGGKGGGFHALDFMKSGIRLTWFSSLITPLSIISLYKSLPSRVRSPTPANTEKPPKER